MHYSVFLLLFFLLPYGHSDRVNGIFVFGNDLDTIKSRMVDSFLPQTADGVAEVNKEAQLYEGSLGKSGNWSDIDYSDDGRAEWKTATHLSRLLTMALAFRAPNGSCYQNSSFLDSIKLALDYWLTRDFKNPNWWWNVIGVPTDISNSYLLLEGHLSDSETTKGVEIMKRAEWKHYTGANLVSTCNVQIQQGLYTGNASAVEECFKRIYSEAVYTPQWADGIQKDWSFHQHGPELLAGSYGSVFTQHILDYIYFSSGTQYFISNRSNSSLDVFSHLVLDGQQWMIQGNSWDWAVRGRSVTRPDWNKEGTFSPSRLKAVPGPRHSEYVDFATRIEQRGGSPYLTGNRHYWDSDYMSHRRNDYMVTVMMHSNRTVAARCVNDEGKKSEHFGDGVVHLYYTGDEYYDVFPVWDWQRLPGSTCEQDIPLLSCEHLTSTKTSGFVGGVSDGDYGAAFMQLLSRNISVSKMWFFFDSVFVAGGVSLRSESKNSVFTSVANRLLNGSVIVRTGDGATHELTTPGNYMYNFKEPASTPSWIYHDNTGYVIRSATSRPLHIQVGPRTGNWDSIGVSNGTITRSLFDMYIDHGSVFTDAGEYLYFVFPGANVSDMSILAKTLGGVKVSMNGNDTVAVYDSETLELVCWGGDGGKLVGVPGWELSVSFPAFVIARKMNGSFSISVSSPVYPPADGITVSIDRKLSNCEGAIAVSSSGNGTSIRVKLPGDEDDLGQTVTVTCKTTTN